MHRVFFIKCLPSKTSLISPFALTPGPARHLKGSPGLHLPARETFTEEKCTHHLLREPGGGHSSPCGDSRVPGELCDPG